MFCRCGFSRFWFSSFVVLSGLISILISGCFRMLSGGLGLVLNALECYGPRYSCFWCSLACFGQPASKTSIFTRVYTWILHACFVKNTVFSRFWPLLLFRKLFWGACSFWALKRRILRGLERLVKSAKVKRVSAVAVLLAV